MNQEAATIDKIIERIKQYNPSVDEAGIRRAFGLCVEAHGSQMRNSGEPYYIHPLEVSYILADMELDSDTVIAGLLHDVIEDTPYGYEKLKNEFGEQVAYIVEGVTKLDKISFASKEEQQIETLRKMFFAMAKDVRVILVKLADRLHNMRTMKYMPEAKQREKSRETLEVYAPLAHRLGISKIKSELEDLSIKYLDSVGYYEIVEGLNQKKSQRDEYVAKIKEEIGAKLKEMNINASISGRAKHIYSIYRKMYSQGKMLDEIYDLFAVRIIVDTVTECYSSLGMVHELYKPIPGRFKDYIAMPKPNMYQSLHTTLIDPLGKPFEVQIRTWEMHKVAEQGVAAHWKYKEGKTGTGQDADDEKLAWIRQLLEVQNNASNSEDFLKSLKIDLFADEVFVFTPKGDVVSLPLGATPVDFAFYIHTAVGYRMIGAKANARIVPLDYELQNGDIVEIITSSAVRGPSRDWLNIVKTGQARSKINAWFRKEYRELNIEKGKESVDREMKKFALSPHELFKPEYVEQMLRRYGFKSLDDAYSAVGFGGITANKIVARLREFANAAQTPPDEIPVSEQKRSRKPSNGIEVEGIDNCLVRLSKCCNPVPGDDIIGVITKGRGVSVHRVGCVNLKEENMTDEMKERLIRCTWADGISQKYAGELDIECADRKGILADIASVVAESQINILCSSSRAGRAKMAIVKLEIEVTSRAQVDSLIKKLHRVPGIFEIRS